MARKLTAEVVGHIECSGCGGEAAVFQNVKSYLYTRCGNCGCDQRNGRKVQERLYWTMQKLDGAALERPANIGETKPDWLVSEPEPKPHEPKPVEAVTAVTAEPAPAPQTDQTKPTAWQVAGVMSGIAIAVFTTLRVIIP